MKRRAKMRILAWVLTVCLCLGILPADLFGGIANVQAEEAISSDAANVLTNSGWTISDPSAALSASVSTDADGTKVLTLNQTSTGCTLAGDFSGASILSFASANVDFAEGYTISADVKVSSLTKANNNLGVAIGDKAISSDTAYYAYEAFRGNVNLRAVYCKTDGTYGSTSMSSSTVTIATNEAYTFSFQRSGSKYEISCADSSGNIDSKSISSSNVNAAFFTEGVTSAPAVIIEGANVEIRNLKVLDASGNELYNLNTAGSPTYTADFSLNIDGTDVGSLSGSYVADAMQLSIASELAAVPTAVTVTAGASDTLAAALGAYTAAVDTDNNRIAISAGSTVVAYVSYSVAGEVKRLVLDAEATTWNFVPDIFGNSGGVDSGTVSPDGILSLTGNGMAWNSGGHGLIVKDGVEIGINVPAGQTTVVLTACQYANANTTACLKVDGQAVSSTVSLFQEGSCPERTLVCTTTEPTTVTIAISSGGSAYIHYITAKTETVQPTATVSGTIDAAVNGEKLLISKAGTTVAEAVIADGAYSVNVPIGSSYTIEFENSSVYKVAEGATIDLTEVTAGETVTNNLTYKAWNATKVETVTIGGTTFTITPGAKEGDVFSVVASAGDGSVELVTASEAIVWANLGGKGEGTISNVSYSDGLTGTASGNKLSLTYTGNDLPESYVLHVKDNSATGVPTGNGSVYSYDLKDASVLSKLYTNQRALTGGKTVSSKDKLFTLVGNSAIYYNGTQHGIAVQNGDAFTLKVAGDATIQLSVCKYPNGGTSTWEVSSSTGGTVTPSSCAAVDATDGALVTVEYTGDATTLTFTHTSSGEGYLHSVTVKYPVAEVEYVKQTAMPTVPADDTDANTAADTDGIPRSNKQDSVVVLPVGQKLNFTQTGGNFNQTFSSVKDVAYYLFPMTADKNTLEFDVEVTKATGTSNEHGFFAGVFTNNYVYSLGLRKGGTNIRGIYSKNEGLNGTKGNYAGAGSPDAAVSLNTLVHYEISFNGAKPKVTVSYLDDAGVAQTYSWSQSALNEPDGNAPTQFYYGFAISNVSATVTNMIYKDAKGNVLYDQNACYYPLGSAPVASAVSAVAAESREYIDVTWTGDAPKGDGTYVVEMQKDGGAWTELTSEVTDMSYRYELPAGEGGAYCFRVCGQLGKKSLGGTRNAYATMSDAVYVVGALAVPTVEITSDATSISVNWDAVNGAEYYQVYRYSFDEGEAGAQLYADRLTTTSYIDREVVAETPYYYMVKAVSESANNESPLSAAVWAVPTAGHTGDYVYESEATEIFVTKKSYDTVFTDKVTLEGNVYGAGKLEAVVNGETVETVTTAMGDAFAFELNVVPGRNDVNLLFTDANGKVTRETFNFVYLTNYDIVVDASYTGTDGEANASGIPTYKTVQAAVNSVPSGNTDSKVILVMAGDYEERLEVKSPYITLIGEDRENTLIHFYPGVLGSAYEAGGDMSLRCATYIYSSAKGFSAENISFANDYVYATADGKSNKSADAIRVEADQASFVNVKLSGVQDTLYMHSGKQYYYKCVIEGLIDFIYCNVDARAFFNDCEIVYIFESTKMSGYVCAPKTAADATYGLTFYNCVFTSEEGCGGSAYLLARPWDENAYVTLIDCYIGKLINKDAPYASWEGRLPEDARFFEFGTYGPGFVINESRRQISPAKAEAMISADYLGWNPASLVDAISVDHYVGDIVTDRNNQFAEAEREDNKYLWTEGNDTGLKMYDMEGYADAYEVTGGGLLKEGCEGYYEVNSAEEFLDALIASKTDGKDSVIELTADINLGCNEIENFVSYSSVIKEHKAQPLTHPTLMETGVSQLSLDGFYNLTIFSSNGSSIKHVVITMKNSANVIIRNIKFDELWEWDEVEEGDYDRNDWDYLTIDSNSNGIWIDHCTFYKAYDGIVDIKNPSPTSNVTISWCEFLPGSEDDTFFNVMMEEVFAHPEDYPLTYQHLKEEGMTDEQVYMYAYAQKKTHLLGQDDSNTNAAGIRLTLANNYYKDSMDRMPRLRYGKSHVYNCIMDSQAMRDVRLQLEAVNPEIASKLVSNGAISTCGGELLLENCYINGIQNALNSGNSDSPAGYINAINSLYYMDGVATKLEPKNNNKLGDGVLVTNATEFVENLPYEDYELYDAADLYGIVKYNAGAGKLTLTTLQWEKTSYNAEWQEPVVKEEHPNVNGGSSTAPEGDDSSDDDTDTTIDWNEVQTDAKETASVTTSQSANVNLNYVSTGETKVPTSVLSEIKNENITLAIQSGNGVALSISGQKLKGVDISKLQAVDLTVTHNPNVIPDSAVASKAAVARRELSIRDTGSFAVAVDMHVNVGKENAGKIANLYRYNHNTGRLEFCSHFVITADGQSMFALGRGGDYLITVTNTVVKETVWYFGGDYTVQAGDNLSKIAVRYHMPLAELVRRNPQLTNLDMIKPGQRINLNK